MSGNFSILRSLHTQLIQSWHFLSVIFLRAPFWSFWNAVIVSLFFWPHNYVPYCKWDSNSEWHAIFSISKLALIRSFLSTPIARFTLSFICAIFLFQSRCSSVNSVFFTLRLSLFALNQFERFDNSLFTCFDNLSSNGLDYIMSSTNWYVFANLMLLCRSFI